jgi:hypothetical protein
MGGGKGGKGGAPNINVEPSPYEKQMASIAKEYYGATAPVRGAFMEDWMSFLRPPGGTGYGAGMDYAPATGGGTGTYGAGGYSPALSGMGYYDPRYDPQTYDGRLSPGAPSQSSPVQQIGPQLYNVAQPEQDYWQWLSGGRQGPQPQTTYTPFTGDPSQIYMQQGDQWLPYGGAMQPGSPGAPGEFGGEAGAGTPSLYGGYDPYRIPGYAPIYQLARGGLESQFSQAREGILGSSPRGGALSENLANLEMARAVEAGSLPAQIATPLIQDIMDKAYGAAFAAPQTSLGGLGSAAATMSSRYGPQMYGALQAQQMQNQMWGGIGSGLGGLASLGIKGLTGGK